MKFEAEAAAAALRQAEEAQEQTRPGGEADRLLRLKDESPMDALPAGTSPEHVADVPGESPHRSALPGLADGCGGVLQVDGDRNVVVRFHRSGSVRASRAAASGTGAAIDRARRPRSARRPCGVPLSEAVAWGPGRFGVRPPILGDRPDVSTPACRQTTYLRREVDDRLERVIQAVMSGQSRVAVLVGGPGVGKTRACWEAVQLLPPDWRLWSPRTVEALLRGVEQRSLCRPVASLGPRTVVWLDHLERYLLPVHPEESPQVVGSLAAMLDDAACAPVLLLATLPCSVDRWLSTSARGHLYQQFSELLRGGEYRVPATLPAESRDAVRRVARWDLRWRTALAAAPQRPIPFLAGVTWVLDRYEHAPPAVKAVLIAAGDARRVGAPAELPIAFLEQAAGGYLFPDEPSPGHGAPVMHERSSAEAREAVRAALVLSMVERSGVTGPLQVVPAGAAAGWGPGPAVVLSGCLEQRLRGSRATDQPKDSLWAAALTGFSDPGVLSTLARAAEDRGRYRPAARLYARALALGDPEAGARLAVLRDRAGNRTGAEQAAVRVADVAGPQAWTALALRRTEVGDRPAAERALEQAARAGSHDALTMLARQRELSGDISGAERAAEEAARAGHAEAWMALGEARERAGNMSAALDAFQQAGRSGNPQAWAVIARREEQSGHCAGAEHAARTAAMAGHCSVWIALARLREDAGDRAGADRAARAAAAWGDPAGWTRLAWRRERAGDIPAAQAAFEQAGLAGDADAWTELARLHERAGDQAAAELAARRGAGAGTTDAWRELILMREHADEPLSAARALAHVVQRDGRVWTRLARRRERVGDQIIAVSAYEHATHDGDPVAWTEVARRREVVGDRDQAEYAAARAAQDGESSGWAALAVIRERAGDGIGAEHAAGRAAAAGSTQAWAALGWLRARAGDRIGAARAYHQAAEAGCNDARAALAQLHADAGDLPAAEDSFRRAADSGSALAWVGLAQLREQRGDPVGAEAAAHDAADLGADAWSALARHRHRVGDRAGAEHAASMAAALGEVGTLLALAHADEEDGNWIGARSLAGLAAAAGCPTACAILARTHEHAGDPAAAERVRRYGLTQAGEPETQPPLPDAPTGAGAAWTDDE